MKVHSGDYVNDSYYEGIGFRQKQIYRRMLITSTLARQMEARNTASDSTKLDATPQST